MGQRYEIETKQTVHSVFLPDLGICVTRIVPRRDCLLLCASSPNCVTVVASGTLTSGSWSSW